MNGRAGVIRLTTLLLTLLIASAASAEFSEPLLMDGKKTLYQRILTRPGAELLPCGTDIPCEPLANESVPSLSILYVYKREKNGEELLLVGPDTRGTLLGFLKSSQTIPWKHSLVLSFEQRAGRERVLFFDEKKSVLDFIKADAMSASLKEIYGALDTNDLPTDEQLIAVEPPNFIDIRDQFYLLPILQAEDTRLKLAGQKKRTRMKVVEVASVTKSEEPVLPQTSTRANANIEDFNSAIVFVLDASGSMQAEIDYARDSILEIYERIEAESLSDKVRFGLIGYRDDPEHVEDVEYLSRVFVDPSKVDSAEAFLESANGLAASPVSTRSWAEDGFAGLMDAVNKIDWKKFGGRYVIFITDASSRGPLANDDVPASTTKLSARGVNELALEKEIAIYALHILTQEAERRGDIDLAKTQYEDLARFPGIGSLYYGVPSARKDPAQYREAVRKLAESLVNQVRTTSGGQLSDDPLAGEQSKSAPALTAEETAQAIGRAMQLSYLGRLENTEAPPLVRAWTADSDFLRPTTKSFKVRLLLTKEQLSDLRQGVQSIYETAQATEFEPENFLTQLRKLAAKMGRDPEAQAADSGTLADTNLLGEYLEGLPYESKVMKMTQDMWIGLGPGQQLEFIDQLINKLEQYRRIHDDVDNWVKLHENAEPGDAVYPVPLSILP